MKSVAALAMFTLLVVLAGGGHVLTRIDQLGAELRAQLELVRAELLVHRDIKPDNRIPLLVRRTDALRGAIFALVRTGAVSMPGDPGGDWAMWSVDLEEVRR